MQRIKTVTIDNLKFSVGSLNCREADQLIGEFNEAVKIENAEQRVAKIGEIQTRMLCAGLNHGAESSNEADWTPELVPDRLDKPTCAELFEAISSFSGITFTVVKQPAEGARPGEAEASQTN